MGVSCTRRFQRPQATVLPMCVPKLSKEASLRERKFHHTHARRPPTVTLTWCGAHRLTPTSAHAGGGTLHSTAYRRGPDSVVEHVLCGVLLAPIERHAGQGDARAQAGVVESPLHSTATALPVYQYSLSAGPPLCDHTTLHCLVHAGYVPAAPVVGMPAVRAESGFITLERCVVFAAK